MLRGSLLIIILLAQTVCACAQADSIFTYYKKLNDAELHLPDFKDPDNDLRLKLRQLDVINESRVKHRAEPVKLDILASRVANKMCREAAENNYMGHLNMPGEKPYHRYAFAGGLDHVTENASAKWFGERVSVDDAIKLTTMKELHHLFMAEKSPHDGHKQNCINKTHNFVGLGMFATDEELTYYEEYIDRYFVFENIPQTVNVGAPFTITVYPSPGNYLCFLVAYYEKELKPMRPAAIKRIDYYTDYSKKTALEIYPWQLARLRRENKYEIELKFDKPGIYYIHIYQNKTEITKEKAFNTEGKTEGSGIVIKAE